MHRERATKEPWSKGALIGGILGAVAFGAGASYLESQTHWAAMQSHADFLFMTHVFPTNPSVPEVVIPNAVDVAISGIGGAFGGFVGGAVAGSLIEGNLPGRIRTGR